MNIDAKYSLKYSQNNSKNTLKRSHNIIKKGSSQRWQDHSIYENLTCNPPHKQTKRRKAFDQIQQIFMIKVLKG